MTSNSERSDRSWHLYGIDFRRDRGLNSVETDSDLHKNSWEIYRFFIAILLILLILRISTSQRFRKEGSVHDASLGWILDGGASLNSVETDCDLHKHSWRYSCFSLQFRLFCWFWGFQLASRQRFKKELSVHDASMGWILDGGASLNAVETDSNFHKHSWRYSCFSLQFCWFCWFWGVQLTSDPGRNDLLMGLIWDGF